ncbi:bcs1 [Metarhizium robertsii ARSEF 23]|uniref:Bcs1 n=1 Tax=Metarhizium robertsii (strain ARSEF 23 / ATCC MYA-3075) TaxID=655844 RepID=E9ET53_METRA|nr:bcs1 [Metarhizium robertsii ARSEF 23]EFZ02024.2 bcs1 [Metarhizium robertsii ARSEF 23]
MSNFVNRSFSWTRKAQSSSEPLRLMDIIRPDSSLIWFAQFLSWGLNSYAPLMCVFGLVAFLKTYYDKLQSLIDHYFTVTLHVKATDESFDMLMAWVSSREVDNAARSIIARVGGKSSGGVEKSDKKPISFSPWIGSFSFPFRRKTLSFEMQTVDRGLHKEDVIAISCPGSSVQILKDFIGECRLEYLQRIGSKITMFENSGDYWKRISTKEKRPLATVIISGSLKQELVDDLKNFLSEETRQWYIQRSIPYRRGYLLHGPPGTGKSSLGSAVAGEFNLDIYIISAPSVDDKTLEELFNSLPGRCVVLLEDIDAIGTDRQGSDKKAKKALSLSGLLNTLDGVASQEGRVLIMTTNHIKNLDEALIRPGRIDVKLEIPLADSDVTKDLFSFVLKPDKRHDAIDDEIILELSRLAGDFAKKVPELKFSTAQIMSFLLKHKNSAEDALKEANNWFGVAPSEKQVKDGEGKCKDSIESPQHAEDGLWMKSGKEKPAENRLKRTKKFPDLKLLIPVSPPPSLCASTPPLSAVGESVVRRTSAAPDAGAGTEPDLVVQDHCSKTGCDHNARVWDIDTEFPLDHGDRKMTADDRRGLGIQGWRKEKQSYDKASTPDIGDRWLETQPQHGNRAFHPVGELNKAIIVTTSIEQTTSPSTGSMATSKVQTDIIAMRPTTLHDIPSALPSLDLGTSDLLFGSHDEVGDASGQINGSALLFELLTVPTTRRNEHLVGDSDKNRELNISSAIKDVQKIVPVDIFPGMSLEWRMPDAADGSQGTGLAINLNPSSCNTADETGWVKVVSNVHSMEIEGLGQEAGRPVDAPEA